MNITSGQCALLMRNSKIASKSLLFLLVSSVYIPAYAAIATSNVSASIISTISIVNQSQNGLVFGDISSSSVAGSVVLTPSGARTTTGGTTINSAVSASPAAFDVQGDASTTYAITLPVSVVLNGSSSGSMIVDNFTSSPSSTGVLDGAGNQVLFVGASLNVASNQAFGSYTGQMAVTVAYN